MARRGKKPDCRAGFTALEMVVVLAIIAFISAQVLISFSGLNEGTVLYRSAHTLALQLRKAQTMSIAVTQIPGFALQAGYTSPPAVGVPLSTLPSKSRGYFLFVDHNTHNYEYDEAANPAEKIPGTDIEFPGNVRVQALKYRMGSVLADVPQAEAFITFDAPEGAVTLTRRNGISIGDYLEITLAAPSGQTKKLIVRSSGQITIK